MNVLKNYEDPPLKKHLNFATKNLRQRLRLLGAKGISKNPFFTIFSWQPTGRSKNFPLLTDEDQTKGAKNVDLDHNRSGCFDSFDQHCEKLQEVID